MAHLFVWDTDQWHDAGPVAGVKGDKGDKGDKGIKVTPVRRVIPVPKVIRVTQVVPSPSSVNSLLNQAPCYGGKW